ncbi:MAG: GreA/GreB family elongation factor [Patescibacteria group bacterium]
MQTPIRKAGKYTNLKLDPNLTEGKFDELRDKLVRLKKSHPGLALEVKRLGEMGDFSENAGYAMAKGKLRSVNQKILELEKYLNSAVIIKQSKNSLIVELGCTVTVESGGKQREYLILGSTETNPATGIISHHSPLGQALLGRRVGEVVKIKTTRQEISYKIVKIS